MELDWIIADDTAVAPNGWIVVCKDGVPAAAFMEANEADDYIRTQKLHTGTKVG